MGGCQKQGIHLAQQGATMPAATTPHWEDCNNYIFLLPLANQLLPGEGPYRILSLNQ